MELPFAVESSEELPNNHSDDGSLVTASSQDDSTILQPYGNSAHESFASAFLPSRLISAVSSQWNAAVQPSAKKSSTAAAAAEMNDYTYVNVWETEEMDIVVPHNNENKLDLSKKTSTETLTTDLLTLLLNPTTSTDLSRLITHANDAVAQGTAAKKHGDLVAAVQHQSQAAQYYYQAAMHCRQQGYGTLVWTLPW
jgi:hypothetical protein